MAAVADVGSPSVSSGTSTPAAAALLAASGPGDAFDRAVAELAPDRVAAASRRMYDRNVGISAPPAGSAPSGNPIAVPRSHGFHDRAQSSPLIHTEPRSGMTVPVVAPCCRRLVERLADGEQADDDDDHVDAVEQLRDAEG